MELHGTCTYSSREWALLRKVLKARGDVCTNVWMR